MPDELHQEPAEQDSSLSSAVDSMPDIEALERGPAVDRASDGKFASRETPKQTDEAKPAAEEKAAPAKADETSDDDEDYIELPPEAEGAEAKRIKLAEAIERYNKFEALQADLERARQEQPPPEQFEQAIAEAADKATQYLHGIRQLQQWMQPQAPNPELVNPASPNFNPELYHQQLQQAQQIVQLRAQLDQEAQRVTAENEEKQSLVLRARMSREKAEAMKIWPELQDKSTRSKVVEDFSAAYRFTPEEVKAIGDHRVLAVIKDALAYRQGLKAKEAAVKVVAAKPKLVKASARQSQTGKDARYAAASDRLSQSNSLDDAAEAIGALLG